MATDTSRTSLPGSVVSGIAAGLIAAGVTGLVIQFGFDPTVISDGIPAGVGASGLGAGWAVLLVIGAVLGLGYAALSRIDAIGRYGILPPAGAPLGLVYGIAIWVLAVLLVPLWVGADPGDGARYGLSLQAVLSFALLGVLIGLGYDISPATE